MSDLVAFVFRDQFRAPEVLNELRRREWLWVRDLDEAVVVTLNEDGRARVHLSVDPLTYEGAGWARLWGSLLGTTLFFPLTEVMVDAANGLAPYRKQVLQPARENNEATPESQWWRESLKMAGDFRRDVAALMAPNGSVIFMLLRSPNTPAALKQLRNYGDTIVHTPLSSEQDERLLAVLATSRGAQY